MIGEGGREAKKRKKPHRSCRCHMENGGDLGGKRKKTRTRKGQTSSVAANQNNRENRKGARGETQGIYGLKKNCTRRVSRKKQLLRLIRGL